MKHTCEERDEWSSQIVLLNFTREDGDQVLDDAMVRSAATEENLRPVSQEEFEAFRQEIGIPETRIAAFGNSASGPRFTGSFPGVPYLNTDGKAAVEENWTRGNTGDQWNGEWKFAFVPSD